jgi:hypothetical protein
MEVKIRQEAGYEWALKGMSYSYLDESVNVDEWWEQQTPKAIKRAGLLCVKTPEHAKFLRFIDVWVDIKTTRGLWVEFDTYRIGCDMLSGSTMHKLDKRPPTSDDFSSDTPNRMVKAFLCVWNEFKDNKGLDLSYLKDSLPEGYLQTRMVKLNYATIRNIISQRKGHRYKYWDMFIEQLLSQLEHPELIEDLI